MKKVIWWVFITLFFVSCTTEPQVITLTPSVIPVDIVKLTSTISSDLLITPTVSNAPRPVPTKTFTLTPDPIYLTEEAIVSSCASKERTWYTKYLSATYIVSGKWGVVVCSDNGVYTKVTNESLGIVWEIPAVFDDSTSSELSWYWEPFLWSLDGKKLYMKPRCLCIIDSPWLIYSSGYGLLRLSLETGEFDTWLKPSDVGYSFEFSHDEFYFAFSPPNLPDVIKIRNLMSGDEQNLSFKEKYSILAYHWTPDSSRLVIFTEEYANDPLENGFSVFVYSIKSDALIKLVDKNNLNFTFPTEDYIEPSMTISNLTNDTLELSDIYGRNKFQVDIRSGDIVTILETSTPVP